MARAEAGIAAGHDLTASAGADILRAGGTAADAAIAALFMACVCEPVLASPGGGGFAIALSDGRPALLDFFVSAPGEKQPEDDLDFREVFADFGTTTQGFHIGAGAVAVPGFLPGLFALHDRFGRIPMATLAEPSINAARSGVAVTAFQAFLAHVVSPILLATPESRAVFAADAQSDGTAARPHPEGAVFANPDLAEALDAVTREGVRLATEGEIARAIVGSVEAPGGHLGADDLKAYEPMWREPLRFDLPDGSAFLTNPPPSLGGVLAALMVKRLFSPGASDQTGAHAALARAQAMHAVDRFWREAPQDVGRLAAALGGMGTVALPGGLSTRGTTHISVIDARGDAVAVTVSNGEGNGTMVPGCGFMPNNMLGEEDVNPAGFHRWQPGQRMASMMAPSLLHTSDERLAALGSGGSNRIRTAIFQVVAHLLRGGARMADAVQAPRVHCEKGALDIEGGFDGGEIGSLKAAFPEHRAWEGQSLYFGGVHALMRGARGSIDGAGDPRRAGVFVRV